MAFAAWMQRCPAWARTPGAPCRAPTCVLADPRLAAAGAGSAGPWSRRRCRRPAGGAGPARLAPDEVADAALAGCPPAPSTLRPVLNATGVLLHTNLGRAPLSRGRGATRSRPRPARPTSSSTWPPAPAARAARARWPRWRRRPGRRGRRAWSTTAPPRWCWPRPRCAGRAREIVVSRGELVEIGDGFRLPDLLESHRRAAARGRHDQPDHARRLRRRRSGRETGFILKVHPSNFRVEGFTARRSRCAELRDLGVPGGRRHRLRPARARTRCCPTSPTPRPRCATAPTWSPRSGDKLLGGPQAGLLLGRRRPGARGCAATRWPGRCGSTS